MKKILSVGLVFLFLAAGTAWAGHKKSKGAGSKTKSHIHKKKTKKKKGKKKKGSQKGDPNETKVETEIGKKDVTLDLKDK